MEYLHCWEIAKQAESFSILRDDLLDLLGGNLYLLCEGELIFSISFARTAYNDALTFLKDFRKQKKNIVQTCDNFVSEELNKGINLKENQQFEIMADLAVLINGELGLAWHIKYDFFEPSRIDLELHINHLSVKFHRKAAIAWEFRKFLVKSLSALPFQELEMLKSISELHKQNYYLWEYRRWLFENWLFEETKQEEFYSMIHYCETHPSDSSAFHYFYFITNKIGKEFEVYEWIQRTCEQFYGPQGLYTEKMPPGYESLNLFRAKITVKSEDIEKCYFEQQRALGRNTKYLYYKESY